MVTAVLREAVRRGTLTRRVPPALWATELNWTTGAVPPGRQAAVVARALHRLWAADARVVAWHFLEDQADRPTRPAGLRRAGATGPLSGAAKPYLRGFALPFDAARLTPRTIGVWVLPAADGPLVVQRQGRDGGWHTVRRVIAEAGVPVALTLRRRAGARLRVTTRTRTSAAEHVPRL